LCSIDKVLTYNDSSQRGIKGTDMSDWQDPFGVSVLRKQKDSQRTMGKGLTWVVYDARRIGINSLNVKLRLSAGA
jgi:hypothetical protein